MRCSEPISAGEARRSSSCEQIGEQVVVAKPRPPHVERGDERARVLEALQDRFRTRAAGQRVGERAADALEDRRAQEQVAHLRRLVLQHLRQQVARHSALAAGELGHEALRVGVPSKRDRRQSQARRPAFGPLVEQRHGRVGERHSARVQQLARLLHGEAQIVGRGSRSAAR